MKKIIFWSCTFVLFFCPVFVCAQTVVGTPQSTTADLQDQINELKEELNQMEIKTQTVQGQTSKAQKATFGLSGGSYEQDLESNNNIWSIMQGQTLHLKFFANPTDNLKSNLDLQLWGWVANDLTQFEDLNNLANQNIFFTIRELDVNLDTGDFAFQAFKGMGYGGYYWSHDDFYSLFPDTWDVDKPFRYTGNAIPMGMNVKGERDFDGLELWAGPQLQWGASPEAYVMYQHKIGSTTLGFINKFQLQGLNQGTFYGAPVTTVEPIVGSPGVPVSLLQYGSGQAVTTVSTTELYFKVSIGDSITFDNVGLYSPGQVNHSYTYVQPAAPGAGTLGSNYNIFTATTTQTDAFGYQGKLTFNLSPIVDAIIVNGEYSGILAGDRERVSGEISKTPFPSALITADATWQQPVIGPNPNIVAPNGTVVLSPRGQNDPFQVTSNPISGFNDRQMTQFKLSFVYNPGAGWLFRYNPNDFGGYNINTDLDTPFSIGVMGILTNYPTGTDLFSYVSGTGVLTWEGTWGLGQAPTNGYQPYVSSWTMWRTGAVHWVLDLEGGYSQSALSYNDAAAPYTYSYLSNLTARINNTSLSVGYGVDNFGPEDWNKQFGMVIGEQWSAQAIQKFGNSTVSLKYVQWDNNNASSNGPTLTSSILYGFNLPLQELYATYTFNF